MVARAVARLIGTLLAMGCVRNMNPATKIARRDPAIGFALAGITNYPAAITQIISAAVAERVKEVYRHWHYGNLLTIRKGIERIDERARAQGWSNALIGQAYRDLVKKHGEKWLLLPDPEAIEQELPPSEWYYLKQFMHINPEEWNNMIRLRQALVANRDQRSIATMSTLDREAQRLQPARYAANVEFGRLF